MSKIYYKYHKHNIHLNISSISRKINISYTYYSVLNVGAEAMTNC